MPTLLGLFGIGPLGLWFRFSKSKAVKFLGIRNNNKHLESSKTGF
jgi:hypothetical protein